jgi:hypothetical protein
MADPHILSEIILEDVSLNLVEPNIYSVYSIGDSPGDWFICSYLLADIRLFGCSFKGPDYFMDNWYIGFFNWYR